MKRVLLALGFAAGAAAPARAHLVSTGFGPFYDGIAHLLRAPGDVLAVLAVALLAGLRGKEHARPALFALSGTWLAGGAVGAAWPAGGELALAGVAATLLCAGLAAADAALPRARVVALAAGTGALHGYGNGASLDSSALALLGAVLASFTLQALASALVASRRAAWQTVVARVAASWVAASALLGLAWQLRRP